MPLKLKLTIALENYKMYNARMRIDLYEPRASLSLPPNPNIVIGHNGSERKPVWQRNSNAAVIFVPSPPIGATKEALKVANIRFPRMERNTHRRIIAVTDLPVSVERDIQAMTHGNSWADHLLFDGTRQDPPLDIVFSKQWKHLRYHVYENTSLTDKIIFLRREHRNGTLIGETLRKRFGVKDISIIPNTHIGYEEISAEVAQYFGLNYPSPETVRQLGIKSEFRKLQRSLGLRAPEQSPVIITNTEGLDETGIQKQFGETPVIIADTGRQAKAEILSQIEKIGEKTGKDKVVLKSIDSLGSVSVRIIDRHLTLEKKEKLVEKHLLDRDEFGRNGSIVEEFIDGIEVGCHITTSGGKVAIKYTRKTMAKGKNGDQSEEVEHIVDPKDPIFDLCNKLLTPQIMKVLRAKDLLYTNASHNADAMLDSRYFDGDQVKNRPPDIAENDESQLLEWNAARKGGTALEQLMAAATEEWQYPQWELLASMGESDAIDAMNAATYKNAGIIHTDLWDTDGHAIDIREVFPWIEEIIREDRRHTGLKEGAISRSKFYKGLHTFDTTYKRPGVFDQIKELAPVGDYLTKGPRPILGVSGSTMAEARQYLNIIKSQNGIFILRDGAIYVNHRSGGYKKLEINPGDRIGTFLREQRGLEYHRGRWELAA